MAIPQTSIPDVSLPMVSGTLATTNPVNVDSFVHSALEGTFGSIALAVAGQEDEYVQVGAAGEVLGIVLHSHQIPTTPVPTLDIPVGHPANVLRRGVVWVTTIAAVTSLTADAVSYVEATGAITSASGAGFTAVPTAKFRSLAGAGEVVKVELNLP